MRLVRVRVADDQREQLLDELDDRGIDYMITQGAGTFEFDSMVEFPIPTQAVGDLLQAFDELGFDEKSYTVLVQGEMAFTPNFQSIQTEYAGTYDPLPEMELRSKARDISHDTFSFVAMMVLSGIVAAVGLVVNSPAVVVGSMVIAPIIGPPITAAVGTVFGDTEMLFDSIRLQALGLGVAILGAVGCGLFLKTFHFMPQELAVSSLDVVAVRLVPNVLALIIGIAGGVATAFTITTDGALELVGVTVAAALVPAAAGVGIGIVWGEWLVAWGMLALLILTIIAINLALFATLWGLGYRPAGDAGILASLGASIPGKRSTFVGVIVVMLVVAGTGIVTANYIQYERQLIQSTDDILDEPEYAALSPTGVRSEYSDVFLSKPETITVTVTQADNQSYHELSRRLEERITAQTGRDVTVRVRFDNLSVSSTDRTLIPAVRNINDERRSAVSRFV